MRIKRTLVNGTVLLILSIASLSAARALPACVARLDACNIDCNRSFSGGTELDALIRNGCRGGCAMGYTWCTIFH